MDFENNKKYKYVSFWFTAVISCRSTVLWNIGLISEVQPVYSL